MGQQTGGVDYSRIHRIDSPANRRLRRDVWPDGHDLGQQSFATLPYFDHLVTRLAMGPDTNALDLGSGSGGPAIYMASKSGCRITGLDVNEVGVEVARGLAADAGLEDRVEFVLGDGMHMPFDDAAFDIVYSMNVLNVSRTRSHCSGGVSSAPTGWDLGLSLRHVRLRRGRPAGRGLARALLPRIRDPPIHGRPRLLQGQAQGRRGSSSTRSRSTSATSATRSSAGVTDGPSTAMPLPRSRASGRPTTTSSTSTGTGDGRGREGIQPPDHRDATDATEPGRVAPRPH